MRALATSLGAWRSIERQEGVAHQHGFTFPLAIVNAIGAPHGLDMVPEEQTDEPTSTFDAVFVSVMDSRTMMHTRETFDRLGIALRRCERGADAPLVWAGGAGLYNPLPYGEVADLIVCGDAEEPLPTLLSLWAQHGNTSAFLDRAAFVEGVFVPTVHGPTPDRIVRSVAPDITTTLVNDIRVNLNGMRRVEIARGCKFSCRFCSLGWHAPLRENTPEQVITEIRRSPRVVHLQAGDAESHSGITDIRAALTEHGGFDTGWTGRLDTTQSHDEMIDANKRFAFGVEGLTWESRRLIGKGFLTDERLIGDTLAFLDRIEGDGKGRAAWHMIAGLPGETPSDATKFAETLIELDRQMTSTRNLSVHWQPFQPLPGTPMQWFAAGSGARRLASLIGAATSHFQRLKVRHHAGRTDRIAALATILSRCTPVAGVELLAAVGAAPLRVEDAEAITGAHAGVLTVDELVPWHFVYSADQHERLARSYRHMIDLLEGSEQ